MDNVLEITIDPDIKLDETQIKGMPDDIKARILITMTRFCRQEGCHWTELTWEVKPDRTIHVRKP